MSFTIMGIAQGVLLLFILIGLLVGIWKGLGKSVIRIFTVLAMAVICFFTAPPIAKALVNTNISKLGINIAGVHVETIKDAIIQFLQKIKVIDELMASSPTFASFIETVPALILNVVVFILFYLVLLAFSHLFSWLIAKFTLKKHKKGEHKRFRLLGGLIGAVQAVLIFAILAIPVFGLASTAEDALKAMKEESSSSEATAVIVDDEEEYILLAAEVGESTSSTKEQIEKIENAIEPYVKQFNKAPMTKVFKAIGLAKLETKIFNKLTTGKINKTEVSLKDEVVILAKVSNKIDSLTKISATASDEVFDDAKFVIKTLFESKLFSRIAEETINHIATEWLDTSDPTAFGIKKPDLGETANELLDALLVELKNATRKTLENDMIQAVVVAQTAKEYGILEALTKTSEDQDKQIMTAISREGAVSSLITEMAGSDTLCAVIPQLVSTGLNTIYSTVGVPKDKEGLKPIVVADLFDAITSVESGFDARNRMIASIKACVEKDSYDFSMLLPEDTAEEDRETVLEANKQILFGALADEMLGDMPTVNNDAFVARLNVTAPINEMNVEYDFANMENCKRKTQEDLPLIDNVSKEDWQTEKVVLGSMFENFIAAYNSTQDIPEGDDVFDHFDFNSLGLVFDSMRHSILLDGKAGSKPEIDDRPSFNIVKALLQSDLMDGITVNDSFINIIRTNWEDETFRFETAFETLGSTVKILSAFANEETELSPEDVKSLIEGLSGEGGEAIKDMLKDEILSSGSSDDSLVQAVTDILDGIAENGKQDLTEEEAAAEANALNTALDILNQTNSGENVEITDNEINALLDSEIIYQSIIDATTDSDLGTQVQEAAEGNTDLQDNLVERYNNAETEEEKAKINSIYQMFFGTNIE